MSRLSMAANMGLLIGVLGVLISLSPIGLRLEENIGLDLLFKLRKIRKPPSEVMIVSMDEGASENFNLPPKPEKWPRFLHARLIEKLAKEGAAAIAFDVFFDEPRSPDHDNILKEAISNAGNVLLCECLKKETVPLTNKEGIQTGSLIIEKVVPPVSPFAQSALALAPFPLPKVPVKVSQYWLFKTGAGYTPTLPVVMLQIFALDVYDEFIQLLGRIYPDQVKKLPPDKDAVIKAKNVEKLVRTIRNIFKKAPDIAEKMFEDLENSSTLSAQVKKTKMLKSLIRMYQGSDSHYLNFYGPPGTIRTISYHQVFEPQEESAIDFKGKAVFVGFSARMQPEQRDGYYTVFSETSGLDISGVEICATAFSNLLERKPIKPQALWGHIGVIFLWGIIMGSFCILFSTFIAALSVIGIIFIYLFAAYYLFANASIWWPLVLPLFFQAPLAFFSAVLWKYFDTNRERKNIRKAFGYFLPNHVVDNLAKNMVNIKTSRQIVYGTCLFTDAEHYTALSETMDPQELSIFMNKYYEAVFEPVRQHGGIVSDVKGDSMLAIWTTSHPDSAFRNQACLSALDIMTAVYQFEHSPNTLQLPTRIGLHSGPILLGTVGAIDHYEYRPVGDIVNTASRLEGLNKYLGTQILVSEDVLYKLNGFLTRELGKFLLAGKAKSIVVYELICRIEEANEQQLSLCAIFSEALNALKRQSWDEAMEKFYESMRIHHDDGPSNFYLDFCKKSKENPPGDNWNGLVGINKK